MGAEAAVDDRRRRVGVHEIQGRRRPRSAFAELRAHVANGRAGPRMHEFGVVFVEHLLVDHGRVLALLAEAGLQHLELHGQEDAEKDGREHRRARSRVMGRRRQKEPIHEHVARAEETEQSQADR